jgi:hypothetical protein
VTADLFAKFALPPNTDSLNIPKITQGTLIAAQTADGTRQRPPAHICAWTGVRASSGPALVES